MQLSLITNNLTIKEALQEVEDSLEDISAVDTTVVDAGDNVNRLVASTSADAEPTAWHFLVVDSLTGSIKVIDKSFVEVD